MQTYIHRVLNFFFATIVTTTALSICGIVYIWFFRSNYSQDLPYLSSLVSITVVEIVAIVIAYAKKGIQYLPRVEIQKSEADTLVFLHNFISRGSSVSIVSNRISWITRSDKLLKSITQLSSTNVQIEIFITTNEDIVTLAKLKNAGVNVYVADDGIPPEARFTLINGNRRGAEELAIARGTHPNHEITIFDNNSGPQIIALAKDILRITKEKSHDACVE
ncbi:hypothetical protein [Solidesulfovibrio carbinolicus]|uniref:Uncharacterized protein n=1 Tax=Solidesulfovibrio carbinolicus TaxID=296842 RepID=A0A4P6HHT5_9BACT|nr:hypothetical protein [Solidesulfovibrio carbinolicus]QAZ66046.1 hypothetical protein C3Y92_01825 [Solidesulfovibrio carbinolicus]